MRVRRNASCAMPRACTWRTVKDQVRRQPRELLVHCLPKPPQSLPTVGILITQKFFCASSALLFTTLDGRP